MFLEVTFSFASLYFPFFHSIFLYIFPSIFIFLFFQLSLQNGPSKPNEQHEKRGAEHWRKADASAERVQVQRDGRADSRRVRGRWGPPGAPLPHVEMGARFGSVTCADVSSGGQAVFDHEKCSVPQEM